MSKELVGIVMQLEINNAAQASAVVERTELVKVLTQLEITDSDQLLAAVEALSEAMTAKDVADEEQTLATAALKAQLEVLEAPFKARVALEKKVIDAAKGALIRRLEADDAAERAAIDAQTEVPAPRKLPKGLSVKRTLLLESVDVKKLIPELTVRVANTDAILAAVAAGHDVDGVVTKEQIAVQFRRK